MKKIGLLFRETVANRIKNNLKESSSVFIIKYSGLSSPDLTTLRQSLRSTKAEFFIAKNTIIRRALKDSAYEPMIKFIDGPCGLVFTKEEPVDTARALYGFSRDHGNLKLEGGFLKEKILDNKDIERLACLPGKEVLRAQLVMTLNSPISSLVIVLNQALRKFVWCLEQIKQKKSAEKSPQSTDHNP